MLFKLFKPRRHRHQKDLGNLPEPTDTIAFNQVSISLGGKSILENLSLTLNEQRIGIIGSNGSGKSTLIRLINGLHQPTTGDVNVFGLDSVSHLPCLPKSVGFIFQNPDHQIIFPTVIEELAFGLEQLGEDSKEASGQARTFLKTQGADDLADQPIQSLSEGQKQLVCILAVLIMRPRLLLLDEPFSSLDLLNRERLFDLVKQQCERLIMVSHELDTLESFDRVLWIENGQVHMDGEPTRVIAAYRDSVRQALRHRESGL